METEDYHTMQKSKKGSSPTKREVQKAVKKLKDGEGSEASKNVSRAPSRQTLLPSLSDSRQCVSQYHKFL